MSNSLSMGGLSKLLQINGQTYKKVIRVTQTLFKLQIIDVCECPSQTTYIANVSDGKNVYEVRLDQSLNHLIETDDLKDFTVFTCSDFLIVNDITQSRLKILFINKVTIVEQRRRSLVTQSPV